MDPFIGEIRIFGFEYAPQDWAFCNGQQLPVQQFQALMALLANTFGTTGNPPTAFSVPNLQSQIPLGAQQMTDGTATYLNKKSGEEQVRLLGPQLPAHSHALGGEITGTAAQQTNVPSGTVVPNLVIVNSKATTAFSNAAVNTTLSTAAISSVGGNGYHENRQPFLAINFCICTQGVFPDFN